MPTCPAGHDSTAADYCDVCGARLSGAAEPPAQAPAPGGAGGRGGTAAETMVIAARTTERCPDCGTPRTGRFCEEDGYDFLTGAAPPVRHESGPPAPALAAPPSPWSAVVTADRSFYDRVIRHTPPEHAAAIAFPPYCPDRVFALVGREIRIGRKSVSRGIIPEIDLTGPPQDPGVSHVHAVLLPRQDDTWVLIDPGSTNGTMVNDSDDPVQINVEVPVRDGDRIHLGAWTTITLRRAR